MSTIRFFYLGEHRYRLNHNNADDSRSISTVDLEALLRIDSDLRITNIKGELVGRIKPVGNFWALLVIGSDEHELGPHNNYHWAALENAEIAAAKILIPTLANPIPSQCTKEQQP